MTKPKRRSTVKQKRETATTLQAPERNEEGEELESMLAELNQHEEAMDGANFPFGAWDDATPADFMDDEEGKRISGYMKEKGEKKKPWGTAVTDLTIGDIDDKVLPPRSIWNQGDWKSDKQGQDWYKWVVSGEGTPGAYETREYTLPGKVCGDMVPVHPADWDEKVLKSLKSWKKKDSDWGKDTSSSGSSSKGDSLPFGLRIRCPGCGHFFKSVDLGEHSKSGACPANPGNKQDGHAMWVIECACHPGDLLAAAEVLEGFPLKPKMLPPSDEKTPDVSGEEKKEEVKDEAGGSAEPASTTGPTTG